MENELFYLVPDLPHVGPKTTSSSSLREDELEGILEPCLGGLAGAKHQVAWNLSEVGSSFLGGKFWVQSVNVLKVVILQDTSLHGILLLPPFSFLLLSLLIALTFDPLTAKYCKEVLVDSETKKNLLPFLLQFDHDSLTSCGCHDL